MSTKKPKPFAPQGGGLRNFLNSLAEVTADELHCVEHAKKAQFAGNEADRQYFLREADRARALRQKMTNAVNWDKALNCRLKHRLHSIVNLRETLMRALRQRWDVREMLECLDWQEKDLEEIARKMFEMKGVVEQAVAEQGDPPLASD